MLAPSNPSDIETTQTGLPIGLTPTTIKEIRMTSRRINNGKAAGPDNMLAEPLEPKTGVAANMLQFLFKLIVKEKQIPTD